MSDGGTFCLLSGLEEDSPFTHLAPVAASFHPMLVEMAEPERLPACRSIDAWCAGLDVPGPHGAAARRGAGRAGANVTYREIDDLSHTYPREINAEILRWMHGTR